MAISSRSDYPIPKYMEEEDATYVIVSEEFETLVWQNGDEFVESSFYVNNLVQKIIASNSFDDNLICTWKYYHQFGDDYEKLQEFADDVEEEYDEIEDYDVYYDKLKEKLFLYLAKNTQRGKAAEEVREWLCNLCLNFTTEFSEADTLSLEEIQEVIDVYNKL